MLNALKIIPEQEQHNELAGHSEAASELESIYSLK